MAHATVLDGIQSGSSGSRHAWLFEPAVLEPTPTQKLEEGMGLFLKHAGFSKGQQGSAVKRLSCLPKWSRVPLREQVRASESLSGGVGRAKAKSDSAKSSGKQVQFPTVKHGWATQYVQLEAAQSANPVGSPDKGAATPVGFPD
eukprot:1865817-Amphidinium_carterae.2